MKKLCFACLLLMIAAAPIARSQDGPEPLPKQFVSVAAGADLLSPRTVVIGISSRRDLDLVSPVRAQKLAAQMKRAVLKTVFTPVSDVTTAQLSLDLVVESERRWDPLRSQKNPYVFLLLRERMTGRLLFCGYKRVGFHYPSAADDVLRSLADQMKPTPPPATGDIRACAAEAMRLPDVGL